MYAMTTDEITKVIDNAKTIDSTMPADYTIFDEVDNRKSNDDVFKMLAVQAMRMNESVYAFELAFPGDDSFTKKANKHIEHIVDLLEHKGYDINVETSNGNREFKNGAFYFRGMFRYIFVHRNGCCLGGVELKLVRSDCGYESKVEYECLGKKRTL